MATEYDDNSRFWKHEPENFWLVPQDLEYHEDAAREHLQYKNADEYDLRYMTFRTLYDIRNAMLMIVDKLDKLNKGND